MKSICVIDSKDYNDNDPKIERLAARAIIYKDNLLAMITSLKYKEYKFPGGGINVGEDNITALIREVKEETGLIVIPSSIKEYGSIREIRKSIFEKDQIFDMTSFYYTCEVEDEVGETNLDPYEIELGYKLEYILPTQALDKNKEANISWSKRENIILELLIKGEN